MERTVSTEDCLHPYMSRHIPLQSLNPKPQVAAIAKPISCFAASRVAVKEHKTKVSYYNKEPLLLTTYPYCGSREPCIPIWVVVKIKVPFRIPIKIRHLIFRVPKKGS